MMQSLATQSLGEQVEIALKEEITLGRLKPGDSLSIGELSRQLGTSVTPVRDAIQKLAAIGFVKVLPRKEVRVEELNKQKLSDVFEIRLALECLAARSTVANIPTAELERAWTVFCQAEKAYAASGDIAELLARDSLVHDLIIDHCGNEMLVAMMQGLRDFSRWAQRTVIRCQPQAIVRALPEHKKILAALRARSSGEAEKALQRHLSNTLQRTLPYLEAAAATPLPTARPS